MRGLPAFDSASFDSASFDTSSRTQSANWLGNQAADVSYPSLLSAFVECKKSRPILRQVVGSIGATLDPDGVVGQTMTLPADFTIDGLTFKLSLTGSGGYVLDCVLWPYDPNTKQITGDYVAGGQAIIEGDFSATEVTFEFITPFSSSEEGTYCALLIPPVYGSLTAYYAVGNRYRGGSRVTAMERTVGSVMTEHADEDLYFEVLGHYPSDQPQSKRWLINNDGADNIIEASVTSTFDPSVTTLPVESCTLTVENGIYAGETSADYDFTGTANKALLKAPGIVDVKLGFFYDDSSDSVQMTRQRLEDSRLSDDELYMTFEGSSFALRLDERTFYGGRYDAAGIGANVLFAEILDDAAFPEEGGWNYRIGDENCKVSAGGRPLWGRTDYSYYHIDPALSAVRVYVPIPPVTHREALTMLAAYTGAHIRYRSDGSLDIRASYPARLDYHLDIDRIYDRPEVTQGTEIGKIISAVHGVTKAADAEVVADVTLVALDRNADTFRITHDACADGSLALTGATLIGTPTYNTYSTVFQAIPDDTSFQAVLTAKRVEITSSVIERTYPHEHGEVKTFDNPIASEIQRTLDMLDRYQRVEAATRYRFTMRDDPAIETADRLYLDTLAVPAGIPVLVTDIKRTFNGGIDGEYTVIADPF